MEMKSFLRDSPIQIVRAAPADAEVGNEGDRPPVADAGTFGEEADGSDVSDVYEGSESEHPETLSAPTLDGCDSPIDTPPMDSDGEYPDSQRPGAWMGNFYKKHAKHIKSPEHIQDQPSNEIDEEDDDHDSSNDDGDDGDGNASQPVDGEPLSDSDGGEAECLVSSWDDWKGEYPYKDGRLTAWVAEILYKQELSEFLGDKQFVRYIYLDSKGFFPFVFFTCGYRYQNLHAIRICLITGCLGQASWARPTQIIAIVLSSSMAHMCIRSWPALAISICGFTRKKLSRREHWVVRAGYIATASKKNGNMMRYLWFKTFSFHVFLPSPLPLRRRTSLFPCLLTKHPRRLGHLPRSVLSLESIPNHHPTPILNLPSLWCNCYLLIFYSFTFALHGRPSTMPWP